MTKRLIIVYVLAIIALSVGCSVNNGVSSNGTANIPQYLEYQHEVRLELGGYGYEVGDIVLIDTQREPELGDIVQFDSDLNNSTGRAMGPSLHLAKIIALPGDNISFQKWSYEANGYEITLGPYYKPDGTTWEPQTRQVMWGTQKIENVAGMMLKVPEDEFLGDKRVGEELTGKIGETVSSQNIYNRFTVKKEAITGVILKKLGHDKEFEESVKKRVY